MSVYDTQLRRQESSSSRESSPGPTKKKPRPAFHGSDDEDPSLSPVEADDTPPPADRPLIRQAVAFGSSFASEPSAQRITTYEAQIPPQIRGPDMFLPGQFLPIQTPVNPPVPPKPKKRKKKDAAFIAQSGRFRLDGWANNAYQPPLQTTMPVPGSNPAAPMYTDLHGPYGALYRIPQERSDTPAAPARASRSVTASSDTLTDASARPRDERTRNRRTAATGTRKKTSSQRSQRQETGSRARRSSPLAHAAPRRDYYRNRDEPSTRRRRNADPGPSDFREEGSQSDDHESSESDEDDYDTPSKNTKTRERMVIILAYDMRNANQEDMLVVELKAQVRPAEIRRVVGEPVEKAWWANSKDLLERLQKSPSRIGGPARVYTLRKQGTKQYRQILMKVTAGDEDEYVETNLTLRDGHTTPEIDIVIENLPVPGTIPPPPVIPSSLLLPPPVVPGSSAPSSGQPVHSTLPANTASAARPLSPPRATQALMPLSPPRSSHAGPSNPPVYRPAERAPSPRALRVESSASPHLPSRTLGRPFTPTPMALSPTGSDHSHGLGPDIGHKERREYDTPPPDATSAIIDEEVAKAVNKIIMDEHDGWQTFFQNKFAIPTASNRLKAFRFVFEVLKAEVGQPAPFQTRSDIMVEDRHVMEALRFPEESSSIEERNKLASEVRETVHLVDLYGPEGTRLKHPEIIQLLKDDTQPKHLQNPIKNMLRRLRNIDEDWKGQRRKEKQRAVSMSPGEYSDD